MMTESLKETIFMRLHVFSVLLMLAFFSVDSTASTPAFEHNGNISRCMSFAKIGRIDIDLKGVMAAIDHSEGQHEARAAMSYGAGYATGAVAIYKLLKPAKKDYEIARELYNGLKCSLK